MADQKISALTNYATPLDADVLPVVDIANSLTKKVTWLNIKVTLKAYFDTIYTTAAAVASTYATLTTAQTLTNKNIAPRVVVTTQSATPTINTDNTDVAQITGLAQAVTSFTTNLTGTPSHGKSLIIEITDNGTARAITWGSKFEASTQALPTTTVISTMLTVGFRWNSTTSKWRCVSAV